LLIIPQLLYSNNIKIHSIIKLEESIPNECGLRMVIEEDKIEMIVKIKKVNKKTYTVFKTSSVDLIPEFVDLIADDLSVVKLIDQTGIVKNNEIYYEGIADTDKTASFFQKLIVSGGKMLFNSRIFEISGPLESKVRLEYLFCTGEMFHPKYEK